MKFLVDTPISSLASIGYSDLSNQVFSGGKNMMNEELSGYDEEWPLDDQLGVDDPLDLIRAYIDCSLAKSFFCDSNLEPAAPAKIERPATNGRLCFVITKNKSSSWAEDLSDFTSVAECNRVYN